MLTYNVKFGQRPDPLIKSSCRAPYKLLYYALFTCGTSGFHVLSSQLCSVILLQIAMNSCLFISGVFFYFWSEIFTFINRKMHTFDLLIVKGHTLRLLIVKCVSYDY